MSFFFFSKQKTAYEMRISDWSSDVCSSDLSKTTRILLALAIGLAIGIALAAIRPTWVPGAIAVAQPIGTAWLNGLQMTIVPLVVALIVTGIAASAEAARAGRLPSRALALGSASCRERVCQYVEISSVAVSFKTNFIYIIYTYTNILHIRSSVRI